MGERMGNPRISSLLVGVTWLEVAVLLVAGGGLLVANPTVIGVWPWPLLPFNLRFLGALYTAALVAALLQALHARWAPARIVTTMIFVFTLVVTALSFVHLDRFDFALPQVWVWFVLYLGVCANAGWHLWRYRNWTTEAPPADPGARRWLGLLALASGGYGLLLLVAPAVGATIWPWRIDAFHAQLYSVAFLTPAAGALMLARSAAPVDWRTLGATLLAWGALPPLALVVVDLALRRVDWKAVGPWAWLSLCAAIAVAGAWMLIRGLQKAPGTDAGAAA